MTAQQDAEKPANVKAYRAWLESEHRVVIDRRIQNHYETVRVKLKTSFETSPFWSDLCRSLRDLDAEYLMKTSYGLFMDPSGAPEILVKPFDSFLLKTFRQNVLDNQKWPDPPPEGWLLPDEWYSRVHDVVRTSMVVKYLDGVDFLCGKLTELCDSSAIDHEVSFEARDAGYYAAHFNLRSPVEIPKIDWDTVRIEAHLEVQITTQVQDLIRRLLHKYYERTREAKGPAVGGPKWQWDYESDEFRANYLGHILHYVEGMIMGVRPGPATPQQERRTGNETRVH